MGRKNPKDPIKPEVWERLEKRDLIKTNYEYFERLLRLIDAGFEKATAAEIEQYFFILDRAREVGSVKKIVDSISDQELEDWNNYLTFSIRFQYWFKNSKLSLDELGNILGVTHTAISKSYIHETKMGQAPHNSRIERHYLAAYSLVFSISPYYLIGTVDDPKKYVPTAKRDITVAEMSVKETADHAVIYAIDKSDLKSMTVEEYLLEETYMFDLIRYITTDLYQDDQMAPEHPEYGPNAMCILPIISLLCDAKMIEEIIFLISSYQFHDSKEA